MRDIPAMSEEEAKKVDIKVKIHYLNLIFQGGIPSYVKELVAYAKRLEIEREELRTTELIYHECRIERDQAVKEVYDMREQRKLIRAEAILDGEMLDGLRETNIRMGDEIIMKRKQSNALCLQNHDLRESLQKARSLLEGILQYHEHDTEFCANLEKDIALLTPATAKEETDSEVEG